MFYKAGAKVILAARRTEALEEVKQELISGVYIFYLFYLLTVIGGSVISAICEEH